MYDILILNPVRKFVNALPESIRKRIIRKVVSLETNPRPHDAIKLEGSNDYYRIRVGDYRIIYRIQDDRLIILIIKVAHRRESYR